MRFYLQSKIFQAHRVQKCLQRLVRALAAERSGALAAWRRAAAAGREAAAAERASAADRLQVTTKNWKKKCYFYYVENYKKIHH